MVVDRTVVGSGMTLERRLPPRAASASAARRLVIEALAGTPYEVLSDSAVLAVSELVTNALVHAGTEIDVQVSIDPRGVLVEVHDGNPQTPLRRSHSRQSGTGRGLHLVDGLVDEWGIAHREQGKVVWFRLGRPDARPLSDAPAAPEADLVRVELCDFPLLIHAAWQEHSAALLREYLLMNLSDDEEIASFQRHAEASEALALLEEQSPRLDVEPDPDHVMADAVEPQVTAPLVELSVPRSLVGAFLALDMMMNDAVAAADAGDMMVPTTQPELREMRRWVCDQVRSQALTAAEPEPWSSDLHQDVVGEVSVPPGWVDDVTSADAMRVATDDTGQIVAVSGPAAQWLGYDAADLVGRRLVVLIPRRFRQAHVAGLTQHMLNGRNAILGREITVPMCRVDDTEVMCHMRVEHHPVEHHVMFVADLRAA